MCVSVGRATSVESLKGSEVVLGVSPFEAATTLTTSGLDHLEFAVECVYLRRDVENTSVGLVVAGDLSGQSPVVCAAGQFDGLVIGR